MQPVEMPPESENLGERDAHILAKAFVFAGPSMAVLDARLRFVTVNDAFAKLDARLGGERSSLALDDLWPNADRLHALCREALMTGGARTDGPFALPVRHEGAFGERLFLASIAPETSGAATSGTLGGASKGTTAVILTLVDVDERARRSLEISKSRNRYRTLVHASAELVWTVDAKGKMAEPSAEWLAFTGRTVDETKDYGWLEDIHPDDRESTLTRWHRSANEGPLCSERRVRRHDGEWRDMVGRTVPIMDEAGAIVEWIGTDTDVTEQRIAERALREQESDLRLITEALPVRIAYIDDQERYRFVNAAFEGYEGAPVRVVGRTFTEVHGEQGRARFEPQIRAALAGETVHFETSLGQGPNARHVAFSFIPRTEPNGRVAGFYAISNDVTEQRRLQDQLHHAQKMEAIGRLAGGVAHDFNNLLTVILSYAALLENRLERDETALRDVREIRRASELATGLTRRLLAFARRDVVHARVVDVNEVVANVERLLVRVLGEHVALSVKLAADLPKVKADLGQLEQVLVNLAVNARDAMPDGGALTLESSHTSLSSEAARLEADAIVGDYVVLRVSDTGVGMTPEVQAHIFEPFFTTKAAGQGTGLGLATCYGIVRHAGGHMRVASTPGNGATFEVWLPATDGELAPRSVAPRSKGANGKEVVLVVEDEPRIRKLVTRGAKECGYEVLEATNGVEALRLVESHGERIRIIVTDVVMPEMGGRELARRVKARWPKIEILFTSGYAEGTFFDEISASSDIHFVAKPYLVEELLDRVRQIIDAAARRT